MKCFPCATRGFCLLVSVLFALPGGRADEPTSVELPQDHSTPRKPALAEAARGRFKCGVATIYRLLDRPQDQELLLRYFDFLTPENCLKMQQTQPAEGEFDFQRSDAMIAFAEQHGLGVAGHVLLWGRDERTPDWFFKKGDQPASRELVLQRLETHIQTVAGRYRGRIATWDVVNEALSDSEGEFIRDSKWSRMFGEEFIVKAFQYARDAAPDALLIYNDYRCDQPGKIEKLARLVKSIQRQGGPIDAIGLQAHYESGAIPFDGIEAVLIAARDGDLKVVFSELDIDVITRSRWYEDDGKHRNELRSFDPYRDECPPDVLESQAAQYAKLFALIAEYSDVVERVTFWNLHDGQTWLNDFPWKRHNHPLLFDRQRQPKPAYNAVVEVLEATAEYE